MTHAAQTSDTLARGGADLSNWRTPPYSRWAFRHAWELMPTAVIAADPSQAEMFVEAPLSLDGFQLAQADGGSLDLAQALEATATSALVVLSRGKLVHEVYDQGITERTPHIVMSMSKSVLGLVTGRLAADGVLDLERPVTELVPEMGATAYAGATLRHLLDMRAGAVFSADEQRAYTAAAGWERIRPNEPTDVRAFLAGTAGTAEPHGGPFRYVSANSELLGWAIERATGRTFAELASELLWRPMGAQDDACITLDSRGAARCTGGVCATARDLARLGQLILRGGARNGRQVIDAAWLEDMRTRGDREAWDKGEFAGFFPYGQMSYRGGWYVVDQAPKMLFAMGVHGQNLFVDPTNEMVVAKLSFHAAPIDFRAQALTHQLVAEIRRCLQG